MSTNNRILKTLCKLHSFQITDSQKHPYHILTTSWFPILATNTSLWDYVTPTNVAIGVAVAATIAFLGFTPQGHAICSMLGKAFVGAGAALTGATKNIDSQPNSPTTPSEVFTTPFPKQKNDNSDSLIDSSTKTADNVSSQSAEVSASVVQEHITKTVDVSTQTDVTFNTVNEYVSISATSLEYQTCAAAQATQISLETLAGTAPIIPKMIDHGAVYISRTAFNATNEALKSLNEQGIIINTQATHDLIASHQAAATGGYLMGYDGTTQVLQTQTVEVSDHLAEHLDNLVPIIAANSRVVISAQPQQQLSSVIEDTINISFMIPSTLLIVGLVWAIWPDKHRRS